MKFFIYMAAPWFLTTNLLAEEKPFVWDEASVGDDWGRAVREFRRDHNFGLMLGQTRTHWKAKNDGLPDVDSWSSASEVTLEYSFHIPWTHGFGYSLGTSISIMMAEQSSDTIQTHYRASLPGLEGGLVYNFNERWRTSLAAIYGWERVDGLKISGHEGRLSLSEESISGKFSVDYFYKLTWAVRLECEMSTFTRNASASYDLENLVIRSRLGLIKHLL